MLADDWVARDEEWQRGVFESTGKRPQRIYAPDPAIFATPEEHQRAVSSRRILCHEENHEGERMLQPGQYYSGNVCKQCKKRAQKSRHDLTVVVEQYDTVEEWMLQKCNPPPDAEMTVGFCPMPVPKMFASQAEYDRAVVVRKEHDAEFRRQYYKTSRSRAKTRELYHQKKNTEEGRRKLTEKTRRDDVNKRRRLEAPVVEGMRRCPVGPHDAPIAHFLYDPVVDLGIVDYKGSRDRTVCRNMCKVHFDKSLHRQRRSEATVARKEYKREQEQLIWVKDMRKRWKEKNREKVNASRRLFYKNNPEKARLRAEKCAEYQAIPENAFRICVMQTRYKAEQRGIKFELSDDKINQLFSLDAQCYHCGITSTGPKPLGVHRLHHEAKEYTDDGTVTCCKPCKFARGSLTIHNFRIAANNVVMYQDTEIRASERITYVMGNKQTLTNGVDFNALCSRARKKNMAVEISADDHKRLTQMPCYLCGVYGNNGIDRKDNNIGYTRENSFACCACCNMMKKTMNHDDFVNLCRRIVERATH